MNTGSEKPLLIASIFAPSESNELWLSLQQRFVARYTGVRHDHMFYCNGVELPGIEDSRIIGHEKRNGGHSQALAAVMNYLRIQPHEYFLILDSDCFPVHTHWFEVLTGQMARFGKSIAAPLRTENLDRFPHPCAFFFSRSVVQDPRINFEMGFAAPNLLGETVTDVGNAMLGLLPEVLPLMRSNALNLHPVAAALYHDLFYHHGGGTRRKFAFRVMDKYRYLEHFHHIGGAESQPDALMHRLRSDPEAMIELLRFGRDAAK